MRITVLGYFTRILILGLTRVALAGDPNTFICYDAQLAITKPASWFFEARATGSEVRNGAVSNLPVVLARITKYKYMPNDFPAFVAVTSVGREHFPITVPRTLIRIAIEQLEDEVGHVTIDQEPTDVQLSGLPGVHVRLSATLTAQVPKPTSLTLETWILSSAKYFYIIDAGCRSDGTTGTLKEVRQIVDKIKITAEVRANEPAPKAPPVVATPSPQPAGHVNSIGMEFILVPAGSFFMGASPANEAVAEDETPPHSVTITRPFYLGKFEVTQEQWAAVMGTRPSQFAGASMPVEQVSWDEVQEFIARLNSKEKTSAYALPTEAEWEYACVAGGTSVQDPWKTGRSAWHEGNSGSKTHRVGILMPNDWGFHDMHGNVWEWCRDFYDQGFYLHSPTKDPFGPVSGRGHALRGGAWDLGLPNCRATIRGVMSPREKGPDTGFRVFKAVQ